MSKDSLTRGNFLLNGVQIASFRPSIILSQRYQYNHFLPKANEDWF